MADQERAVLWIAFVFPPLGGTQGRWMAEYLAALVEMAPSLRVEVLTVWPSRAEAQYDEALTQRIPRQVITHRIPCLSRWALNWIRARRQTVVSRRGWGGWVRVAARAAQVAGSLEWLTLGLAWLAWNWARARRRFGGVYVFVDPFVSLALGWVAKELHRCTLVVEYGDPWAVKPSTQRAAWPIRCFGRLLERAALPRATLVLLQTNAALKAYRMLYRHVRPDRWGVAYGGVSPDGYHATPGPNLREFLVAYTGTLNPDLVDPVPFFEAAAQAARQGIRFRLVLVGAHRERFQSLVEAHGLEGMAVVEGHRPLDVVRGYQLSAAVLLVFDTVTRYKVPSKIAEYAFAGRPILLVSREGRSEAARLVLASRLGVVVQNRVDAILGGLTDLYRLWRQGLLEQQFNLSGVPDWTNERIVRLILSALVNGV